MALVPGTAHRSGSSDLQSSIAQEGASAANALVVVQALAKGKEASDAQAQGKAKANAFVVMQALAKGKEASDAQAQGKAKAAPGGYAWAAAGKVSSFS